MERTDGLRLYRCRHVPRSRLRQPMTESNRAMMHISNRLVSAPLRWTISDTGPWGTQARAQWRSPATRSQSHISDFTNTPANPESLNFARNMGSIIARDPRPTRTFSMRSFILPMFIGRAMHRLRKRWQAVGKNVSSPVRMTGDGFGMTFGPPISGPQALGYLESLHIDVVGFQSGQTVTDCTALVSITIHETTIGDCHYRSVMRASVSQHGGRFRLMGFRYEK